MYKESFLMAWASLIANKMRSILTMLGIIIGVAAVIALVSIGNGVKQDIQNSISSLGSNLLMVMPGAPRTPGVRPSQGSMKSLKVSDYQAISKLDGVKAASPYTANSYVTIYQSKNWTTTVSGVSSNFQDVNNWTMAEGRFISSKNVENRERVAVVGQTYLLVRTQWVRKFVLKIFRSELSVFLTVKGMVLWGMTKMMSFLFPIQRLWNV